ncbi:HlyD family type I secretion periplasmic adaptor subunit [Rhodobacter sp. Har01]|uniref:HlyD family type I secretion periplasmic adaptor subunit n=1 Tax=Rhodobacter sp. Har01 TaxID=2883999 RepID=UPI001D0720AC|nr:HlyD family type I secretion periplasmic adaptor subunit [Rhodobacter sp. Har01]MCB6177853.1 HlyD family type I secretion periplasmic adaptor subunit [Rhodobacter sp. Har01]
MSAAFRPPRVAPEALAFQGDLDRLIVEPPPRALRAWPVLSAGLLAALVGLSALLPLDIVVSASGELAADAPPVVLKPMARAVLAELLVRPGDRVREGQVLARLDPTLPDADRATLQVERDDVAARIARLEAELAGTPLAEGSAEDSLQGPVLASRADVARARRARLAEAVLALEETLAAFEAQTSALEDRLAIARELEAGREDLAARQLAPATEALAARSARLAAEGELAAHHARLAEIRRALTDARGQVAEFDLSLRQEATEALPPLRLQLAQLDDALSKANRLMELSTILAPRDAVVISVAPGGVGAVIAEGEPLIALIPSDATLIAEIEIPSSEVGRVAPGDRVALKIDAFPWRRNGEATGRLDSISPATLAAAAGTAASHPARVTLATAPDALPQGAALLPGMTLTAEIRTGTRTVLQFFLDPLLRGLTESLREP